MLRDWFDSDVQKTVDDLFSLLGDGPKMPFAFLCLQTAWDVYVTTPTPYRNTDGPPVTSALEWMFAFTGSPADWVAQTTYNDTRTNQVFTLPVVLTLAANEWVG